MDNILLLLCVILIVLVKYIGQVVLVAVIIIKIYDAKSISKTLKIVLIAIISFCILIMICDYRNKTIDDSYIEMQELVENESLIGLSEEEVVALLGEPSYIDTYKESKSYYTYSAGTIFEEWFWGKCYSTTYYQLRIEFDESGKVTYAYIQESA